MIIELADDLFGELDYGATLDVYQLFRLAWSQRHVLLINPTYEQGAGRGVNRWLEEQGDIASFLADILEIDVMRFAAQNARVTLAVEGVEVDACWDRTGWPARHSLPLRLAARVAETPLRLLVENRRNDAAFIRACLSSELRERLDEAEAMGWIRFEHGGGLGEMFHWVDAAGGAGAEVEALRLWVLHDSDARACYGSDGETRFDVAEQSWGPRSNNRRLAEACATAALPISHHQLRRRTIENYLPRSEIRRWADRAERRRRRDAFVRMNDEQRDYFNMKAGLADDRRGGLSPIYASLDARALDALGHGFGRDIGARFGAADFTGDERWRAGVGEELEPVVRSIFERM